MERLLAEGAAAFFGQDAVVEGLAPLGGGASRELWGFDVVFDGGAARRACVLRRDPAGDPNPGERRLEHAVLRATYDAGVPVPEPLWFVEPDADGQGAGLVMARLEGEAIARRILRDERFAVARERLVGQVAAAAAAMHRIDPAAIAELQSRTTGLHGEGPAEPGPLALIGALEAKLDELGEPQPALELGLRRLRLTAPAPVEPRLVHGDLRLGNIMVGPEGLVAVLDWELVHTGDPLEDLGWLCSAAWRFGSPLPALGLGTREALLEAYSAAGGREVSLEELRWWEIFSNVRWGVICVQQASVHLSGKRRSLEHAMIGRRTCEPEWDALSMLAEEIA